MRGGIGYDRDKIREAATLIVAASDSLHPERADYVCDGVADNVEIQAAIDALPATGGKVVLTEGHFYIASSVLINRNNIYMAGSGMYSTYIQLVDNADCHSIMLGRESVPLYYIGLSDFTVDGRRTAQGASYRGIASVFATDTTTRYVSIKNVQVLNTGDFGIYLAYLLKDSIVDRCILDSTGGIYLSVCDYIIVTNCNISNNIGTNRGIFGTEIEDSVITNNIIRKTGAASDARDGIRLEDCENVVVSGNSFNDIGGHGIMIVGQVAPPCHNISIIGNVIRDCVYEPICVEFGAPTDITISGNVGIGGKTGIWVSGSPGGADPDIAKRVVVTGNVVGSLSEAGFVGKNVDELTVVGNLFYNIQGSGISLAGVQNSLIANNKIIDAGQAGAAHGIYILHTASTPDRYSLHNVIQGNQILALTGAAISNGIFENSSKIDYNTYRNNIIWGQSGSMTVIQGLHSISNSYDKHTDLFIDVLAVSATHVRSNEDLSEAIPNTFTLDAQPDVPRTLSGHFDAHAQITAYTIVITGTDAKGNTVTETFTEAASPWDFETVNAYATITSIIMTARTGTGAGDTMDIGITDVLGLSNIIYETGDIFKIKKNNGNAVVAAAQVDTDYDTYDMAVIGLAGGDDFTIWFKSNLNIIS